MVLIHFKMFNMKTNHKISISASLLAGIMMLGAGGCKKEWLKPKPLSF